MFSVWQFVVTLVTQNIGQIDHFEHPKFQHCLGQKQLHCKIPVSEKDALCQHGSNDSWFMERTIIYLIMLLEKSDSIHVFISHV